MGTSAVMTRIGLRPMNRTLPTPWKPTKAQLLAAHNKSVPDVAAKDLIVLFAGINPGLYTAAIGHHFGRPGNRFWPALHGGGFTPRLFSPFEESLLLELVFRPADKPPKGYSCNILRFPGRVASHNKHLQQKPNTDTHCDSTTLPEHYPANGRRFGVDMRPRGSI
jgi:Uracil DNA glycosylase superfamily